MPGQKLERIRALVRLGRYEITDHAWEEMADDDMLLVDVETAILSGEIVREDKGDPRGTIYVLQGVGTDRQTEIGVVARYNERRNLLVITAYKIDE